MIQEETRRKRKKWRKMVKIHWWQASWRPSWPLPWLGSNGAHRRGKRNAENSIKGSWRPPQASWHPPHTLKRPESQLFTCSDRHQLHGIRHGVRPLKNCTKKNLSFPIAPYFSPTIFTRTRLQVQHILHYKLLVFRGIMGPCFVIQVCAIYSFYSFRHNSPL